MTVPGLSPAGQKAKPRKKTARKTAAAECDLIFSRLVRRPGFCANCGSTQNLQCAHGFSRRYRAVRCDLRNAWCLCKGCHLYFTMRPIEWDDFMLGRLGDLTYHDLRERALYGPKVDYRRLLADLRALEAAA